ncbi:hypothetical protein EPIB1_1799 [Tritonibacter mobilis]|nr:hypothetical protein EPIB1_1799 [Tritonibacter mobilis]
MGARCAAWICLSHLPGLAMVKARRPTARAGASQPSFNDLTNHIARRAIRGSSPSLKMKRAPRLGALSRSLCQPDQQL